MPIKVCEFALSATPQTEILLTLYYVLQCSEGIRGVADTMEKDIENCLDKERLADIVRSVSSKYPSDLEITCDEPCQKLLLEYLDEVVLAAMEQAAMLANHRGSNIVEEEDIQLVLDKKLGIPVPGAIKKAPLYKNSYHALSLKNKDPLSKNNTSSSVESNTNTKRGMKRKSLN